jgi:hypothetical protein
MPSGKSTLESRRRRAKIDAMSDVTLSIDGRDVTLVTAPPSGRRRGSTACAVRVEPLPGAGG